MSMCMVFRSEERRVGKELFSYVKREALQSSSAPTGTMDSHAPEQTLEQRHGVEFNSENHWGSPSPTRSWSRKTSYPGTQAASKPYLLHWLAWYSYHQFTAQAHVKVRKIADSLEWANILFSFLNIYLWLHRVLLTACRIFIQACGIFCCGMWFLTSWAPQVQ